MKEQPGQDGSDGLRRIDRPIFAHESFSVRALTYAYPKRSELGECFSGVTLQYLMTSRRIGAQFSILERPYRAGRLYLLPPQTTVLGHGAEETEHHDVLTCEFSPEWLGEVSGVEIDWTKLDPDWIATFRNRYIECSISKIAEGVVRNALNIRLVSAICNAIAIELAGELDHRVYKLRPKGRLTARDLLRIEGLLGAPDQPIPHIAAIAAELQMSPGHLRQLFQNATGETLYERIQAARIARALHLLADQAVPLKQIAYLLGYSHHSTFTTAFKKHYGIGPSEFRAAPAAYARRLHIT